LTAVSIEVQRESTRDVALRTKSRLVIKTGKFSAGMKSRTLGEAGPSREMNDRPFGNKKGGETEGKDKMTVSRAAGTGDVGSKL